MRHRGKEFTNEADAEAFAAKHKRAWISRLFDYTHEAFSTIPVTGHGKTKFKYTLKPNARRTYIGWHVAYFG